jgi:hypothetical protein
MTVDLALFQLYLLSKMSCQEEVSRCLAALHLSRDDMTRAADSVRVVLDIADAHPHEEYHQILANRRVGDRAKHEACHQSPRDSEAFFYRLPLWPGVLLQINRHSEGWAWGFSFVQDPDTYEAPRSTKDVRPWAYTVDGLRACLRWQDDDCWSDYQRDIYDCTKLGGPVMRGVFDLGLLQQWLPETLPEEPMRWRSPVGLVEIELITGKSDWLRAFQISGHHVATFSVEHLKSKVEVLRVHALELEGRTLRVDYTPQDPRLESGCVAGIVERAILHELLSNQYQSQVENVKYIDASSGKQCMRKYGACS